MSKICFSLFLFVSSAMQLQAQTSQGFTVEEVEDRENDVSILIQNTSDSIMIILHSTFGRLNAEHIVFNEYGRSEEASSYSFNFMNGDSLIDSQRLKLEAYILLPGQRLSVEGQFSESPVSRKHLSFQYLMVRDYHHQKFERKKTSPGWYMRYKWQRFQTSIYLNQP